MTVVSVLELTVRRGQEHAFEQRFAQLDVFGRSRECGGFLHGRLLRPLSEDGRFLVIADWENASDYQAWLANPVRTELAAELEPLLLSEPVAGRLFEEARC